MSKKRLERSLRVTFLGLLVNAGLAAGKIFAGVIGHSHALIADGVESAADFVSSLIVWRGVTVAAAPADEQHPYGHGKAEPLAAAVVATVLIAASVMIVIGAVRDIVRPHGVPEPFTLVVLVTVIVIKEVLFRVVSRQGAELDSVVVSADAWHHRSDAITSFFAFLGISIAVVGGEGYQTADDYAAILAGGVIAFNGWRVLRPAMDELMDIAPDNAFLEKIRKIAEQISEVARVEKCFVRKSGNEYLVDMHIEVDPKMTVHHAHDVAHTVKDEIRRQVPSVRDVLVHIEPAGREPSDAKDDHSV